MGFFFKSTGHIATQGRFGRLFPVCFLALACFGFVSPKNTEAADVKNDGNLVKSWMQLSLTGKGQSEIELYFVDRKVPEEDIEKVKSRLRSHLMNRLRSKHITRRLEEASETNAIEIVIQTIRDEMRYFGLEADRAVRYDIKEEFGVNPFNWNSFEDI